MKDFTPPGLRLLGLASNGLALSIMLKSVNTLVYNAQKALTHVPMVQEFPKMFVYPLYAPDLVKYSSSSHFPKFGCYFLYKLPKILQLTHNFALGCANGTPFCPKSGTNCWRLNSDSKALSPKNLGTWGPRAWG